LELVKNPAQGFLPVIIEEIVLLLGELLNAFSRNLSEELAEIREAIDGDEVPDPVLMGAVAQKIFTKFQNASDYLFPPIIQTEDEERKKEEEQGPSISVFAYLLPAIAAVFLLFLADIGIRDLFDEERLRTLQRYRTLHANTFPLVLSKTLLAMSVVLASAFILLGIGGLVFGIAWRNPIAIIALCITYAAYAAGLLTALAALVGTEKRANVVNTIAIFIVGFLGGSMMPIDNLPSAITDTLSPYMPTYWFGQTIVKLQSGEADWTMMALKMLVLGTVLVLVATRLVNRRLAKGIR
jgi:ABC-type multidrug transport system permease subunit